MNNLTMGICWIEDQASDGEKEAVKDAVREGGFEPSIKMVKTENDIQECAKKQEHFQEYELILLDLMLGDDLRGDDLARTIRQSFRSTPIVFYSAKSTDKLRKTMADKGIDGVYCTERSELADRVSEIVSDLSPQLNRLSGMRGLAAQTVAKCDDEFRQILLHVAGSKSIKQSTVRSLKQRVTESATEQSERLDKLEELDELLKDPAISSAMLYREVMHHLKDYQCEDIGNLRHELKDYVEQVLRRRNLLAHVLEKETSNGWHLVNESSGKPQSHLTVSNFPGIRSDFLSHLQSARELRELLTGKQAN